jgi:hypothetical protein
MESATAAFKTLELCQHRNVRNCTPGEKLRKKGSFREISFL